MARNDDRRSAAQQDRQADQGSRDKYRDNDDERNPTPNEDRIDPDPDTKTEARGDARENVGNTARGTAAHPTGPEGNDNQKSRER